MSNAGIVAVILGVVVVCARGPLMIAPAAILRLFKSWVKTERHTRIMGLIVMVIALPMLWAGLTEESGLATLLFLFGVLILIVAVPMLLIYPHVYMEIVDSLIPSEIPSGPLMGWRMLGLLGLVFGAALILYGIDA